MRIAVHHPVLFIPEKLIVKRGGHGDQLSTKRWGNDIYRVEALVKILESGVLSETQRELTVNTLKEKCSILINGFLKRGKEIEADRFKRIMERY